MRCLQTLREHYLAVRRSLGAKLTMTDWLLRQFIAFLAQREAVFITTALALEWASEPQGVQMAWRHAASRKSVSSPATPTRSIRATKSRLRDSCPVRANAPSPTSTATPRSST